jgi:hypothetical protein
MLHHRSFALIVACFAFAWVAMAFPTTQASASMPPNPPTNEFPGISLGGGDSFHSWGQCIEQDYKDSTVNGKAGQWVIVVYRSGRYLVVRNGMLWGWFDNGGGPGVLGCPTDNEQDSISLNNIGETEPAGPTATAGFVSVAVQTFSGGKDLYWVTGMDHSQVIGLAQATTIQWAFANYGGGQYFEHCLAFVEAAYGAADISMTAVGGGNGAAQYWDSNPDDYSENAHNYSPALGSLVFWGPVTGGAYPNPYGHVGIYLGEDEIISSWSEPETSGEPLGHVWSFSHRNDLGYPYDGWLMPSGSTTTTTTPSSSSTANGWSPAIAIDKGAALSSVSCSSPSFCVAVDGGGNVLSFNGKSWSSARSVDRAEQFQTVSCPTTSFCVAVGYDNSGGDAFMFNGRSWTGPDEIDPGYKLISVSCPTTSFCVAGASERVFIYSGSTWSAPETIDPSDGAAEINSVSCSSPSFCVAVDGGGNVLMRQ